MLLSLLGQAASSNGYVRLRPMMATMAVVTYDSMRHCLFLKNLRVMCFLSTGTAQRTSPFATKYNTLYNDDHHCFNSNIMTVFVCHCASVSYVHLFLSLKVSACLAL